MSKYTTEVRFICEHYAGLDESTGYDNVDDVIRDSRTKVFDFDYPIFDTAYRPVLETKILTHYYTREICEETVGLWKLRLKAKMNEIMPYYNKLYESELIEFNPLYDADYHKEGERSGEQDNTTTNNLNKTNTHSGTDSQAETIATSGRDIQTSELENGGSDTRHSETEKGGRDTSSTTSRDKYSEWNLYSDTPQGGIEGILGAENEPSLEDDGYLTNATHILHDGDGTTGSSTTNYGGTTETDETNTYGKTTDETRETTYGKTETKNGSMSYGSTNVTTDTGNVVFDGNTTEEYTEHVYGKMPGTSNSKLLKEFRETFLNIDLDIIKELRNLFFNLW